MTHSPQRPSTPAPASQPARSALTFELKFPPGLTEEAGARLFTALSGLSRPVLMTGGRWGRPMFVFELLAEASGPHYLLTVPRKLAPAVLGHLRAVLPGLDTTPTTADPRPTTWTCATQLGALSVNADAKLLPVLWSGLTGLDPDEAVLTQFIVAPAGRVATEPDEPVFDTVGRVAVAAGTERQARDRLDRVGRAFATVHLWSDRPLGPDEMQLVTTRAVPPPRLGTLTTTPLPGAVYPGLEASSVGLLRWPSRLSSETLAMVCGFPIGSPQFPGLPLAGSPKLPPDPAIPRSGPGHRVILKANFVGAERPLALSMEDRKRNLYIVGPTGVGKSTIMENMIKGDLLEGLGCAVFDPKGDLVERVLDFMPRERVNDVVLYDVTAARTGTAVGYNVLKTPEPYTLASSLIKVFDNLFNFSSSAPRATDVLRSVLITLCLRGMTLAEISLSLEPGARGQAFRDRITPGLDNVVLQDFWRWFDSLSLKDQSDVGAPIIRRTRPFELYPDLRASLGQVDGAFDLHQVLAENKILLVPLPRAKLGDELTVLIGTLMLTMLWNAVQLRPAQGRKPFPAYIDEIKMILGLPVSVTDMFSQARSFGFPLTVAGQSTGQLKPTEVRDEIFQNARSKIALQTDDDARTVADMMGPPVTSQHVRSLGDFEALARLCVGNRVAPPVTATTYPPPQHLGSQPGMWADKVRQAALNRYGKPVQIVNAEIAKRHGPGLPLSQPEGPPPDEVGWEPWDDETGS